MRYINRLFSYLPTNKKHRAASLQQQSYLWYKWSTVNIAWPGLLYLAQKLFSPDFIHSLYLLGAFCISR